MQQWISYRDWNYKISLPLLLEAWGVQYLIWGVLCWLIWLFLGTHIQQAKLQCILLFTLPLSLAVSVGAEMIWVLCFPDLPLRTHMAYWRRLAFHLNAELIYNMLIFWSTFFFFRGVGYYQRYREKEKAAQQLEVQLVQSQMRALRMQLNPHFLFNTLNSVSSLMRMDVGEADLVLEQLSSLMRITLERGEVQLIPLAEEMEFLEMYVAIQQRRYCGRVQEHIQVASELHDALVPAMILQPIVENAYMHGLALLEGNGTLSITARRERGRLKLTVINTGVGLYPESTRSPQGQGVGLANVKSRLQLHYGESQQFSLDAVGRDTVQATIALPLQFATNPTMNLPEYGA